MGLERNAGGIEFICRSTLFAGALMTAACASFASSANAATAEADGMVSRVVIVHTDDQVGMSGFALAKSCLSPKLAMSQQKAIEGTQSVLLIMKYDGNGKIVGVHYGVKDVCEFLQTAPSKIS
jgi:hypothetical protein